MGNPAERRAASHLQDTFNGAKQVIAHAPTRTATMTTATPTTTTTQATDQSIYFHGLNPVVLGLIVTFLKEGDELMGGPPLPTKTERRGTGRSVTWRGGMGGEEATEEVCFWPTVPNTGTDLVQAFGGWLNRKGLNIPSGFLSSKPFGPKTHDKVVAGFERWVASYPPPPEPVIPPEPPGGD